MEKRRSLTKCICGKELSTNRVEKLSHSVTCKELDRYLNTLAHDPEVIREVVTIGIGATASKHQVSDAMLKTRMRVEGTLPEKYWHMVPARTFMEKNILEQYAQGIGIDRIAKTLGCTSWEVRKCLDKLRKADTAPQTPIQATPPPPPQETSLHATDEEMGNWVKMIVHENDGLKILLKEKETMIINLRSQLKETQEKVSERTAISINTEAVKRAMDSH